MQIDREMTTYSGTILHFMHHRQHRHRRRFRHHQHLRHCHRRDYNNGHFIRLVSYLT